MKQVYALQFDVMIVPHQQRLCERWDQSSFDPDYATETLETFEPMVRQVFSRKAYDPVLIREGVVTPLQTA